ncbi:metal-dependent hydrolase [Roseivirga sp. BDSF3-8]|uniref:metal-dependent hydrolase n=1 Tax=Roseivirga sp. BDSF3-8 TaxID=3241598 RepID=UPI003531872B
MDSLTQFVLGAAVGEALLGKKEGRKALVWGAVAGTIPDLDVIANNFLNDLQALLFHRGFSHSLFFALLMAPLLAWLAITIHGRGRATLRQWTIMFFWCLFTHPLLDIFTNYGTQLLYPLWDARIAFNTISIVDPLYTLPLLVTFVAVLIIKNRQKRWRWTMVCLAISHVYLFLTVLNKYNIHRVAKANAGEGGRVFTTPALFTNVLWNVIVEKEGHYEAGYYSMLDADRQIAFKVIPKNRNLAAEYAESEELSSLRQFSKGYYAYRLQGDSLIYNDLRFGPSGGWMDPASDFIFAFSVAGNGKDDITIKRVPPQMNGPQTLNRLIERIKGD